MTRKCFGQGHGQEVIDMTLKRRVGELERTSRGSGVVSLVQYENELVDDARARHIAGGGADLGTAEIVVLIQKPGTRGHDPVTYSDLSGGKS